MVAPCTATSLRKGDYPSQMQSRPVYHLHRLSPAGELVTEARIVPASPSDDAAAQAVCSG